MSTDAQHLAAQQDSVLSSLGSRETDHVEVDVLIVGTGPVGCTFARKLAEAGRSVYMVDAGAQLSRRPGEHLKNAYLYQKNIDLFSSVIRSHLVVLSVPRDNHPVPTLNPASYRVDRHRYPQFVQKNQNPDQDPDRNLEGAATTYAVGGMATHWTCAVPRHHPTVERSSIISDPEWNRLYHEAEELLNKRTDAFDHSIRHSIVRDALEKEFTELPREYPVQNLPLAVEWHSDCPELFRWSGSDTVLGPLIDEYDEGRFVIVEQHLCKRMVRENDGSLIKFAEIQDLRRQRTINVQANTYIIAAGAVQTPQILYNSHIRPYALGRYLCEQPVAFCQVALKQRIVDVIARDQRFAEKVGAHLQKYPHDPIPVPSNDPVPQVWIPVSEDRPWHCQVHRDAFHYGEVARHIDDRLVVDLRWFGIVQPRQENRVTFSDVHLDSFEMPQPTFEFTLSDKERETQHAMMQDMLRAAGALGGFLPGSEPQFVQPGLPLHIHGTTRMGIDSDCSVVDPYSRVWNIENLYLGGNSLIPTGTASNPTLTSIALALRATERVIAEERGEGW
jgi:pyranose oxidase